MVNCPQLQRLLAAGFVISLALICVSTTVAQSGRRQPGSASPAPAPTPQSAPTPNEPAEKPKPHTFVVGMDRYGSPQTLRLSTYTSILRNCAQRLGEPESVKVVLAEREMARGDAIKRAKAEKEAYVVWIRVRPDHFAENNGSSSDFKQTAIEFTVLAPTTAKQVFYGNTYPDDYRNSTVIVKPSSIDDDRFLTQAAREVANRILAHFHIGWIKTPVDIPSRFVPLRSRAYRSARGTSHQRRVS